MNRGQRMLWYVRHRPTRGFVASILFTVRGFSMPQISPVSRPFAVFALVALPALAQVNTPPAPSVPATAQAAPATLPYPSAFEGYQSFTEEKVGPWKESNTAVEKIGGWRAYAKEVAEPEAKGGQTPAAPPAAAPRAPAAPVDPHAGHGKH